MVCPWQAKAVSIEGHPKPEFNGLYTHDSTHEGWPVLKSANGRYCYRHTPLDSWFLRDRFTPDSDLCHAHIGAKEGPPPVGAHTWQVWQVWSDAGSKLVDCTLGGGAAGALCPVPSPTACASLPVPPLRCPAAAPLTQRLEEGTKLSVSRKSDFS